MANSRAFPPRAYQQLTPLLFLFFPLSTLKLSWSLALARAGHSTLLTKEVMEEWVGRGVSC